MVHIGDREAKDVAGPHAIGGRAILIPIVKDRGGPHTRADAVCRDYSELPAIIERLEC
jgi:putative hydrolase of the HAD superfamily